MVPKPRQPVSFVVSWCMKHMRDPVTKFGCWTPWGHRTEISGIEASGVYLLAHFPGAAPPGAASPVDRHIVYIGETHRQSLAKRWADFQRSASRGARGHAGGRTYHKLYGRVRRDLYVAAFSRLPAPWSDRQRRFFIRYLEAKLISAFCRTYSDDGLCNKC